MVGIEPSAILTFRDEYPDLVTEELLEAAKELRGELAEKIGEDEAQFVKADILIRRKGSLRK